MDDDFWFGLFIGCMAIVVLTLVGMLFAGVYHRGYTNGYCQANHAVYLSDGICLKSDGSTVKVDS